MTVQEREGYEAMALTRKTKAVLRVCTIGFTASIATAVAVVGSIIGAQGGDFWPWALFAFTVYTVEMIYALILCVGYFRQPEYQRQKAFHERRNQDRIERLSS